MRAAVLALVVAACWPGVAAADPIAVEVIEVAGGAAYVTPGADAGLIAGVVIHLGARDYPVVDATGAHAMVRIGDDPIREGERGSADVTPGARVVARTLPAPRGLDRFVAQWPAVTLPASTQSPRAAPRGAARPTGPLHLMAWAQAFLAGNARHAAAALELGTRLSYELIEERPLVADLDLAVRLHSGGLGGARVPVFVRTAQLRWGDANDPRVALGRLRWASASTGMLDGVRLAERRGVAELAVFGGVVPDPVNGAPEPSASRFGVEAILDAGGAWRPHLAVSAEGSTWQGTFDERRLQIEADVRRGGVAIDAFAEAQGFASDNPWGARAIEVTGVGGAVSWRGRRAHLGIDGSFLRPERSLRLDAALPPDWACVRDAIDDTCLGGDAWAQVTASGGVSAPRWSLDAGGSVGTTRDGAVVHDASGFALAGLRVWPGRARLELGASGGAGSVVDWISADVGVAATLRRRLDARIRLRGVRRRDDGALDLAPVHLIFGDLRWARGHELDLGVAASAALGDGGAVTLITTLAWRPRP